MCVGSQIASPRPPPPLSFLGTLGDVLCTLAAAEPPPPPPPSTDACTATTTITAGLCLTPIFHPNFSTSGDICVNTLKKDWTPDTTLAHVFAVVRCLLIVPFPESSLNDEAGKLFLESYPDYCRKARLWTHVHAMPAGAGAVAAAGGAGSAGVPVVAGSAAGAGVGEATPVTIPSTAGTAALADDSAVVVDASVALAVKAANIGTVAAPGTGDGTDATGKAATLAGAAASGGAGGGSAAAAAAAAGKKKSMKRL